jgi:hypothetical protein
MTYTVTPARYAKNKMVVTINSVGMYKCSSSHMVEALGGRYVGRSHGYVCSAKAADDMKKLLSSGWSGRAGIFSGQKASFRHDAYEGEFTRNQALKLAA